MSTSSPPPPIAVISQPPQPYVESSTTTSIIMVIIIIASAVILSASIYILLRLLSCRFRRESSAAADDIVSLRGSSNRQHCHTPSSSVLDSLPLFTFRSVTGNLAGGDCAVCLSKFEPHDQLRLLPLCCHAFHGACIDAWILSNQTCPLCRSAVLPSDADVLDKILFADNRRTGDSSFRNRNSGSFRIEIGSVSRRRSAADEMGAERQSYSIGSFEYIVGDEGYEIPAESTTHRRGISDCTSVDKESSIGVLVPEPPGEVLAAEVSSGRNWLRDYVDRLTSVSISRTMSLRSSGRFFSGSSRRSDPVSAEDLEANRAGEEISELFRWLSGL